MLEEFKDKLMLPLIYAAAVISAAVICMFLFFEVFGGFALSFVPVFKGRKLIPVICIAVAAVITGIVIAVI